MRVKDDSLQVFLFDKAAQSGLCPNKILKPNSTDIVDYGDTPLYRIIYKVVTEESAGDGSCE